MATSTSTSDGDASYVVPAVTATRLLVEPKLSVLSGNKAKKVKEVVNIENAVYSYIQAVRALGKTQLTSSEIAKNLSLSLVDVNNAIVQLRTKGVKTISR